MVVGVCRISLMLGESHSLKEKRAVLRKIKDRVHQKFNCAIAEVGDQDVWQSAQVGFAVVSNERGFTQSMVQKIVAFIDDMAVAKLTDDEQDYIDYGEEDLEGASSGNYAHWEPEEPGPAPGNNPGRIRAPKSDDSGGYPWDPDHEG
jgi:uncharacterized protein